MSVTPAAEQPSRRPQAWLICNVSQMKNIIALVALQLLLSLIASAQPLAPNAPEDKPVAVTKGTVSKFEQAIAPYIAQGQKTYPDARKRYLAGLPPKHIFFVTVRLTDDSGKFEIVFVRLLKIDVEKAEFSGRIESPIEIVGGYYRGKELTLPEDRVIDWTISLPDGTEEGNAVGKFLDGYQAK